MKNGTGQEKASRNQTQLGLRLTVPEGFLTLIQQNAAPLFWDIPDLKPVWLSGAFSQLKMTANSTYCEAKLCSYRLGVAVWGRRGKKGGFGVYFGLFPFPDIFYPVEVFLYGVPGCPGFLSNLSFRVAEFIQIHHLAYVCHVLHLTPHLA